MSLPLILYTLMAALRDRLVTAMLGLFILGSCLALFFGGAAVIEKDQFTLVFAAGGLRLISVMGLTLFVIFFIRRSFDGKEVEFLLSRPLSRVKILLSLSLSFSLLALVMGLAAGLCLFALGPQHFGMGSLLWLVSQCVENIIMVNTALFFAMYISSAASAALATFGFYVLSRMMGQLLGIVDSTIVVSTGPLPVIIQVISALMPRFDLLGQTSWLLYGVAPDFGFGMVLLQGAVFGFLVFVAALFDFVRRQF